jgi:dihydroorotate dehydrogenase electron transfer subunit
MALKDKDPASDERRRTMDDIEARIIENKNIISNYFLLRLELSRPLGKVLPGQFVMLKIPGNEVFLRRPFSVFDYKKGVLTIMYKVAGRGTEYLSVTAKGALTFVLGPLGNGFHITKRDAYLVVAGGIGVAGIHFLVNRLKGEVSVFFGCSNKEEMALFNDIAHLNPTVSTLDGSCGFKGTAIEMLKRHLRSTKGIDRELFVCGPEGMLKSLKTLIDKDRIPCQVLVEERMACGLGLCFGCVKKTVDENEPYKRVCKEGPVFDLWEISL